MPAQQARRGRPKGSGLDDSRQLQEIAALMAKDPALKPTTAIRTLGVSDPSTIRRLRDKYRKFAANSDQPDTKFDHQPNKADKSITQIKTKTVTQQPRPKAQPARQPRAQKSVVHASEQLGEPASWFEAWCGIGIQAVSVQIKVQTAAMQHMLALPPVSYVVRQHMALNKAALSFYKQQKPLMI